MTSVSVSSSTFLFSGMFAFLQISFASGVADAVEVRQRDRRCACDAGRSTPAIRAMMLYSLALPLLVARVLTDDANDALAADDLALVADLLDADGRTFMALSWMSLANRYLCR